MGFEGILSSRKALLLFGILASSSMVSCHPLARSPTNTTYPYQNSSLCVDARLDDLISRMSVAEKAGQLFHTILSMGPNGTLNEDTTLGNSTTNMVTEKYMSHFNLLSDVVNVTETALWHNRLQELARSGTRWGIPVTMSTDPRHAFTEQRGVGFAANSFSQWPESLGLAALRDKEMVQKFAEVAREEYMAIGLRSALHPQIDLSTEYRWARISNTMGEDANLTSELVVAYLKGFQGEELGPHSVTTITKHFPGGGPLENGEDSHFTYGKNATYPGKMFDHHLIPFKAAIAAGARQMMPYYSRPIGTDYEEVGFSFNKGIITDLLRHELGFEGIVCSDWGLITDYEVFGQKMPAAAWGVESLSELDRAARVIGAGVDQFGGEQRPELIVQLVEEGRLSEARIDESVRRLLREKFVLGLFDNPFVDVEKAARVVGNPYFVRLGQEAQRASYTLLKNEQDILPLSENSLGKVYVEGFDKSYLTNRSISVVETPEEADIALMRLRAPFEPRPGGFEARFTAGSLEYNSTEKARQAKVFAAVPTIVDMYLGRPAAIPEIMEQAVALLGSFGSGPDALLDVVFGVAEPKGKLPFDLPRSDEAVEDSKEDVPFDTKDPVARFGDGLRYGESCRG
ncbi:probable Probable beta-glucosidase C [Ramularia collo-cygni]|uniref:beta-glucosidase n=1 Tax=Ramularia collo-cygni TaxID=112498 RepID=A0A2D3VQZ2_9PEZI|nr:probable Probable beta-glucosidase C [Ramularia collo-cygni]CZT25869.1 probable Probable beta-glucosidase C [Ramularia collo-cygni]